jgi:FtsH-binding integral membrane protein
MRTFDGAVRLDLLGWTLMLVFCLLTFLVDTSELVFSLVLAGLVAAVALWVRFRPSRAALVVSLIFGLLLFVQQIGYSVGSLTQSDFATLGVDILGLVGATCVVVGSAMALRTRRDVPASASGSAN